MKSVVHTIAVPYGWSVEQAWEAITRNDPVPALYPVSWHNVIVRSDGRWTVDRL